VDYHGKDTSVPIKIEVTFVPGSTPDNIEAIKLEVPWDDKPEYTCTYRGTSKPYYVSAKVKEQVALIYVAAGRDLAKQLTVSSWTLLGRLMAMADSDLKKDAGRAKTLEQRLDEAAKVLKTEKFNEIEQCLRDYTKEHMGHLPYSLELNFDIYNPINYYRSVQLLAREGGNTYDAAELGSGLQNAIVLALFRTYAKLYTGTVTIAIEEPELFLHPHAQRMLYGLMKKLSAGGRKSSIPRIRLISWTSGTTSPWRS
jgi:putative ATP-dependent endonuclease of OLD family